MKRRTAWIVGGALVLGLSLADRPSGAAEPDPPFPEDWGRSDPRPVDVAGHQCWFVPSVTLVRTPGYPDTLRAETAAYADSAEPDPDACAANVRVSVDYTVPTAPTSRTISDRRYAYQATDGENDVQVVVGDQVGVDNIDSFHRAWFPACGCAVSSRFKIDPSQPSPK